MADRATPPEAEGTERHTQPNGAERKRLLALSLATLGVVFGDIGTSPIYAFRESFHPSHGLAASPANVLGILSLIFWSLIIVISIKYLGFVLRADNRGEGGIMALTALVAPRSRASTERRILVLAGLFGAALLYGDGMITPAISVLSAIEGLEVATPFFTPYVIPLTVAILIGLFSVQRNGTERVGLLFGPMTLVWFVTLALLGLVSLAHHPGVLVAVLPTHAVRFFAENGWTGFFVLGSVFLVVTGGEALYADMGHFGRRPIRLTWFWLVLPALLINYFGQGASIIENPSHLEQPFFLMAPSWALYPIVVLATLATIIASQAVISGAFSLTLQAVQLGYLPRMRIEHTSDEEKGQVYLPAVNWALMFACVGLVIGFRTSSNLAAAYGVAVTTDMVFTTVLFAVVARGLLGWGIARILGFAALLLVVDLSFWGANLPKVPHGGWFPLVIGALVFTLMTTWKRGRQLLRERLEVGSLPVGLLIDDIHGTGVHRTPGTAVYLHGDPRGTPPALLHNLKHNRVLHERVVLLTIHTEDVPVVAPGDRLHVERLAEDFWRVIARYGFSEKPDIPELMSSCEVRGLSFRMMETTFVLSRETLVFTRKGGLARWRKRLYARMQRNALRATAYFGIPPDRVVELGTQVEL